MQRNDEVVDAFELVLEEIERAIDTLNSEGARAFIGEQYEIARDLTEKGNQMKAFRDRVKDLQKEWLNIFATVVPQKAKRRKASRYKKLKRGLKTPEDEYRVPILQSLVEFGGSAPVKEVLDKVEKLMSHKLNAYDRQSLPSDPNVQRWQNTAQWARYSMVKEGLLSSTSPKGVWEITESGRRFLEKHK